MLDLFKSLKYIKVQFDLMVNKNLFEMKILFLLLGMIKKIKG